jgi:mRNA-degrading endonuclease toxin of MazEF toxin-antitoxin module
MNHSRGDVVWSDDPFKDDPDAGRPWLVLNTDAHPFGDEQYMAVALSTSGYDAALAIPDKEWIDGGTPRQSYVLPWAVHSPQTRFIEFQQGRLTEAYIEQVVSELVSYISD